MKIDRQKWIYKIIRRDESTKQYKLNYFQMTLCIFSDEMEIRCKDIHSHIVDSCRFCIMSTELPSTCL